ncbi:MAG: hypothetical protein IKA83_03790 [Paludibacteraceae bacterium]|nr:hypothetical protein [Paludibacteraceae bacterium]
MKRLILLILIISSVFFQITTVVYANEKEVSHEDIERTEELFRKALLEEFKKQEGDKILEKEYRRQSDSIFSSYISANDIEEIKKRLSNNLSPVAGIDTFLNDVYYAGRDAIPFHFKRVNDCTEFDNYELSSSFGFAYSNSLVDARKIAYHNALGDILFKMGGIYDGFKVNDIYCENLNTWKEGLYTNYTILSLLTDKIKICEKYICRNGVYTVLMYLNIYHKDIDAVKNITYKEADFDNLYNSDKRFSNIIKENLYLLYGIDMILISYPVEAEKCESCPDGWKLVKTTY